MAKKKQKTVDTSSVDNVSTTSPFEQAPESVKIPPVRLVYLPFGALIDHFVSFLKIGVLFALLISAASFIFGYAYICTVGVSVDFPCAKESSAVVLYILLKYGLMFLFAVKWYQLLKGANLNLKSVFAVDKNVLRAMGILAFLLVLNLAPMLSFYLLWIRNPNPDVVVEIAYFAIVSTGFLFPLFVLRFYSLFGFAVEGQALPPMKYLWRLTSGNTLKILIALFFIFFMAFFIFFNFYTNMLGAVHDNDVLWLGISSEIIYEFLVLLLMSLFVGHCYVQKQLLFGDQTHE